MKIPILSLFPVMQCTCSKVVFNNTGILPLQILECIEDALRHKGIPNAGTITSIVSRFLSGSGRTSFCFIDFKKNSPMQSHQSEPQMNLYCIIKKGKRKYSTLFIDLSCKKGKFKFISTHKTIERV